MGQVRDWFESTISKRWLLIIDNADDIDMLYRERLGKTTGARYRLIDYFPRSSNGSIVLTTRNMKVARNFVPQDAWEKVIKVEPWSSQESEQFLASRLKDQRPASKDVACLAELLEHHPLALVQAAAYMYTESVSLARYLSIYRQSDEARTRLLSEEFEDDTRYTNVKNPVATTFEISFEYIDRHFPLSAKILSAMSMLDTKAIPEPFLALDDDSKSVTDALGKLQAYSLIVKRTDCFTCRGQQFHLFDFQALVHLALRAWLKGQDRLLNARYCATKSLLRHYPDEEGTEWETYQVYHPHVLVFLQNKVSARKTTKGIYSNVGTSFADEMNGLEGSLGTKVSWYLRQIGDYQIGERIAGRSFNLLETVYGPTSTLTIRSEVNLAQILEKRGDYEAAEKHYTHVLYLREQLSPDEAEIRDTIHSLADVYKSKGDYGKAENYFQRALDMVQKSGVERNVADEKFSKIHYDLGVLYDRQGRNADAQAHFQASYETRKRQFGPQNLQTLRALQGLGLIYFRTGNSELALDCLLTVFNGRCSNSQLGPDHPDTLRTHCYVASVYRQQKRLGKAEQTLEPILESTRVQLGKDHPHTLEASFEYGLVLKLQSKYPAAEEQFRTTLKGRSIRLGPDHPQTLDTMYELGLVLERLGSYNDAKSLCERVLRCRVERHGRYDNHTLSSAQALAVVLESAGYYSDAELLLLQVIKGWKRNSRTRSMDFVRAHQHLIGIYTKQGQPDKSQPFLEHLYSLKDIAKRRLESNRTLDSKHPLVLSWKHEYGQVCLLLDQLEEALMYCKSALEGQEERLGLTNIDSLRTLQTLGAVLERQGRDVECEQLYQCAVRNRDELEPDNIVLASIDHRLGILYERSGQHERAEQSLRQALQSRKMRLGEQHPDTLETEKTLAIFQFHLT